MGGRGAACCWWDYVAENVRLGNEEEEALHREGDGNDGDGFRGRGGERGRWTWREEGEEIC